jgi:hypothetical protein
LKRAAFVVALLFVTRDAIADDPKHAQAALDYVAPAGCPDRDAFASSIATRLGYDPFAGDEKEKKALVVRYDKKKSALTATLRFGDAEKSIVSETGACDELGAAAAFAAAILLDPRVMFPKPPPKPGPNLDTSSPGSSPWWEPPPPPPPPPPAAPPIKLHAAVLATGCAGCGPSLNVGGAVYVGIAREKLGLDLGARADLPTSTSAPSGREVSSSLVVAEIFPHARFGFARFGLLGSIGALFGDSRGEKQTSLWAAAGARVGLIYPIAPPFFVNISVDGLVVVGRVALRVAGSEVWSSPGFAGGAAIGGGLEF